MAKQAVALRLDPAVLEWADEYAEIGSTSRQAVLEAAVAAFMADAKAGVLDLRRAAAEQSPLVNTVFEGVGDCPKRAGGHVWVSAKLDPRRPCEFCGLPGRDNLKEGESGGFLGAASRARTLLFATLRTPESVKAFGKRAKDAA